MARFDVHKWRLEQYQKDSQDHLLEHFIRDFLEHF